ncbi:MAG TPA: helix-turn-helix domain-containing protein [Candidatus Angelobacter sp.]
MALSRRQPAGQVMAQQPSSRLRDQMPGINHHQPALAAKTSNSDPKSDSGAFEPLLDAEEAAKLLRIHPQTLLRGARRGEIPAIRVGRLWRFRASILNQWLERIAS